ncbi:hypothetical protein CEUSTIGMA_g11586.t1 [Chlamydomonas eustigma]|uniref:Uncharacterized protein n=1 Tax=Chlamydomonas eustigma TaxID=1157962 RepID=A0A250XMB1_9CHLO|nr:hypothetical protein CEUSTIGMA_g11586.t1 [Chlamydomonas eustigma]|eukprot:GAX84163.1 hypothetical protein CEUSTIGMA_g11586.t1 [Chlamydomonas eustigma]
MMVCSSRARLRVINLANSNTTHAATAPAASQYTASHRQPCSNKDPNKSPARSAGHHRQLSMWLHLGVWMHATVAVSSLASTTPFKASAAADSTTCCYSKPSGSKLRAL